jgi:hypothetical protein
MWTNGSADCVAKLMDYSRNKPAVLARVSYHMNS